MSSFFITGTSRGFGLALARQDQQKELAKKLFDRVVVVKLDITDEASIKQAAAEVEAKLEGKGLDVLINNAGVCHYVSDGVKSIFTVNVLGVHWVTRAFLPLLQKGTLKKVAHMSGSSTVGSITLAREVQDILVPAYKILKAAMNSLTVQYALEYEKEGFTFMADSPGLGGGEMADLDPEEGAKASLDIILKAGQEYSGKMAKVFIES
ncbi:short chain oxidoreductase [Aspergillus leporis]|uniref:Short chain oxidoreductase n=1 Tax=Aspergillus leporis TaxID=41062 RepID=A0A5N5X9H4_9EURO|nr:short chain oxidoreductase [Aspergillus leporis]